MIRAALFAALFLLGSSTVAAQLPADATALLDRRVSLRVRDVALRDALDRIALQARIRLSYSGDNLPLDRRVSIARDSVTLRELLTQLVRPYAVEPIALSDTHVVLAARRTASTDSIHREVRVLERVLVTGSVIAASERPLPVAIDVVAGREMEERAENDLSKVLSGSVPGVWVWEQTPTTMLARYGSIRGSSSFSLTFPKIYIDGIEVANPLLLTQISPELVDRVEVIRGPQGAALYGSDAISGVVNIVSRHEGVGPDGTHAQLRSSVGASESRFVPGAVGVQEHVLSMRSGSNLRSGGLTIGTASSGQYVPEAFSREFRSVGDLRLIGARSTIIANARFLAKQAGVPASPLLPGDGDISGELEPQKLRMYALGSTLTLAPDPRWTYTITAGLDGYRLTNISQEQGPVPSVADTALRASSGSANRGTLRASAVTHAGNPERLAATLTLSAEHSTLWDRTLASLDDDNSGSGSGGDDLVKGQSSNTGVLAQSVLTLWNTAFLSAGLRRERIDQAEFRTTYASLPMLGVSVVRDFEWVSMKWRAAYGKGIRAPRSSLHVATREPRRSRANPGLQPEEQAGIEAGVDVRVAGILGLHVTRFVQEVVGLVQQVTVESPSGDNSGPSRLSWYQLQNVGEISNRGWETQASLALGPLSVSGAASYVDSRVQQLAEGYTGDMQPGDRMLAVPARTLSGTVTYARDGYHLSATVSRASDWINYDRLGIARALLTDSLDADDLTGRQLRDFWTTYPGTTRLRASASRDLWRGLTLTLTGENLLGYQRGEPDTITIVPGRTISLGVRARF